VIVAAALAVALLDGTNGVPAWLRLHDDLRAAEVRMEALRAEIAGAEREAAALRDDPFAIEAAIREDLGLARPGETIVRLSRPDGPSARIP
jgi:cell division protein FtsB